MADFKIGLDAEFGFYNERGFLPAHRLVHGTNTTFGTDGNSSIAEIRPRPSDSQIELVDNIRCVFQRKLNAVHGLKMARWVCGARACEYSLGAHIHIGAEAITHTYRTNGALYRSQRQFFGRVFDAFVLPFATLLGHPDNEKLRRSNYGHPSDVRDQSWGWEYRSCSSFLASPASTLGILTVAFCVANEFLERRIDVAPFFLDNEQFINNQTKESRKNLAEREGYILSMPTVKDSEIFKKIIHVLFDMVNSNATYESVDDMKKSWKLNYEAPIVPVVQPLTLDSCVQSARDYLRRNV